MQYIDTRSQPSHTTFISILQVNISQIHGTLQAHLKRAHAIHAASYLTHTARPASDMCSCCIGIGMCNS